MLKIAPGCFAQHRRRWCPSSPRRRRDSAASTWSRRARARASSALRARRPAREMLCGLVCWFMALTLLRAPARRIRSRRRSPDSRCSGSSSRRDVRGWYRGSGTPPRASKFLRGQQHGGRAEAALQRVAAAEGVLQVGDVAGIRHALDGLDPRAVALHRERQAAAHDHAVDAAPCRRRTRRARSRHGCRSARASRAGNRPASCAARRVSATASPFTVMRMSTCSCARLHELLRRRGAAARRRDASSPRRSPGCRRPDRDRAP